MITVGVIRNGARYLSRHLRKNDYWSEGEKEVMGEWIGEASVALGLSGMVDARSFEALRQNLHPKTRRRLTASNVNRSVAFFDIQLSAPKDVSVLAIVGGDERVRAAFLDSAKIALKEMERFAAVRERRGAAHGSDAFRQTGNVAVALFLHDASRDLDPQLHVHAVIANATWDPERNQWMALQPAEMLRASPYIRQVFYRELAGRLRELGYDPHGMNASGFSVRGVEHLRTRFSKRARQVEALAAEFAAKKGRHPTKREVEVLVRESRADKLTEVTTPAVRARQRAELTADEAQRLDELVRRTRKQPRRDQCSVGSARVVLDAAFRHVFERRSVARDGDVLSAALELHPDFYRWRELRELLEKHPDALRRSGELSLRSVREEESAAVRRIRAGRNCRYPFGKGFELPPSLTEAQRVAATQMLESTDLATVLIGDAGTGKTTVLSAIQAAHVGAGGRAFVPLAPTTRARDALAGSGFEHADTVQRFLVSDALQREAIGRPLLIDEAGLLSTQQLDQVTRIAEDLKARLILVGDTKQHYSVQRGDALRNVIKHSGIPVVRLTEVLRQRSEADRRFSRLLAAGDLYGAFRHADQQRMIEEAEEDQALFARAAERYAQNLANGIETLVVIPFWEEIDRFNQHARAALRSVGKLRGPELIREVVKPLTWSEEQKVHWGHYRPGDRLLFVRNTRVARRGEAVEVVEILPSGLRVRTDSGRIVRIDRRHRATFEVGRTEKLAVASGDRVLIRGREDAAGFQNGDFKEVASVDPDRDEIQFTDGTKLPKRFRAWTYGHALTSYRAQGSTAEESILVLGEVAERALARRQFYVGSTRHRGIHRIYLSHRDAILNRLALADDQRELATEFARRHGVTESERIALRPLQHLGARARFVWYAMQEHWERVRRTVVQNLEI